AVAIVIAEVGSHRGLCAAIAVDRYARGKAGLLEMQRAKIPVERVRRAVVGYKYVSTAVTVEIRNQRLQAIERSCRSHTGSLRDVFEVPCTEIVEESAAGRGHATRAAKHP